MDIISKFTIGTEEGLGILFQLREAQIREMYADTVEVERLNQYITQQLNHKEAVLELNNLSTQMLTVFNQEVPAGFVMIKQVMQPEVLKDKKVINLESFYINSEYNEVGVRESLWQKTLSLTRNYDAIWIEVLQDNPLIPFLKEWGFEINQESVIQPFSKPSYILIRWKPSE
ncbi:hypothetical protein [Myroides profundi]|uniref:N-acetyltransferase domain-containing protein n=1 Tax=Myroides profundi TaxID=480520 RepID=A0AAJ4W556_MYRPR|nr:hypothetical protein [Myroides profundi]AJH14405.1 hypothetical protein MPR_1222 [Myroides profundi]SER18335.1 hypothetical protein SAMN04488089_110110 [Myroides profundi]